jgi:UDP-2,3-diacylglucosamine pyrophosphatase LpxH
MLKADTLIVFISDTHIGGSPGHDIFETPEELTALLLEVSEHDGPVELVLAGDFFDFLEIGNVPAGENRASATISRPEYHNLFSKLRDFCSEDDRRVVYLPGNHDAEMWWNEDIHRTLREEGLVDEFALSYAARFESAPGRLIYCEHGNQFDSANTITDYDDPLDTPLGEHIVTDVTRRITSSGSAGGEIDLREVNRVFPLVTIPEWLAGRAFYDLLSRVVKYLLGPLLIGYVTYRIVAYLIAIGYDNSQSFDFWDSYRTLPGLQVLFGEIAWDAALLAVVFVLFFLAIRRTVARTITSLTSRIPGVPEIDSSTERIQTLLNTYEHPPMSEYVRGREIDVFVSGHTHTPSLSRFSRESGDSAMIVNSGCWLRQLSPVRAHLGGPPVFVSRFVQTHARVYVDDSKVHVELLERPKAAPQRLRNAERLAILGRRPSQPIPNAPPRVTRAELSL